MTFPGYVELLHSGELKDRVEKAFAYLENCQLCGWECKKNRISGGLGVCLTGIQARVSSYGAHFGEENPLRGWRGSGTVFFSRCNLRCVYCQNYQISQADSGELVDAQRLATIFIELAESGCHNINLVSPTHIIPHILAAIYIAAQAGLQLPFVYNTGGYNSVQALKLLDGIIDIYMPDMKYASASAGHNFSRVRNYPAINQAAVLEMHRQVGDLEIDQQGLARRGLLVRHLVLPNNQGGSEEIIRFLVNEISPNTYLNLMKQYRPSYQASRYIKLIRPITDREWQKAIDLANQSRMKRLDHDLYR